MDTNDKRFQELLLAEVAGVGGAALSDAVDRVQEKHNLNDEDAIRFLLMSAMKVAASALQTAAADCARGNKDLQIKMVRLLTQSMITRFISLHAGSGPTMTTDEICETISDGALSVRDDITARIKRAVN